MKNLKKYFNKYSATEKGLMTVLGVLIFALSFNFLSSESTWVSSVFADEGSGESSEKSSDEDSEKSEDEKSEDKSVASVDEVSTPSVEKSFGSFFEKSVASVDSIDSVDDEVSIDDPSTEVSVKSEDELSVKSFPTIEEFDAVIELDDDFVVVVDDEKLFFLVPVEIIKTLSLDEDGNVTGVRQTILNRILSWFSF